MRRAHVIVAVDEWRAPAVRRPAERRLLCAHRSDGRVGRRARLGHFPALRRVVRRHTIAVEAK